MAGRGPDGGGVVGPHHQVGGEAGGGPARYRAPSKIDDERAEIVAALTTSDGVRADAATLLGMSRTTLWRRMKTLGLDREEGSSA